MPSRMPAKNMNKAVVSGSFRDPNGFVFLQGDRIYRQVGSLYQQHYAHLMDSGLYRCLSENGLLIRHEEVETVCAGSGDVYKVLKPEMVPFISYPYEWCFSQLKAAALATLEIQKKALEYGMILKDASAYNIQFKGGRPLLIDTLSFEKYRVGEPWVAYKQFCEHFLAPLLLMNYRDARLNRLFRLFINGIPLDLAGPLLPFISYFRLASLVHIHMHSRSQQHYADNPDEKRLAQKNVSLTSLLGLVDNLESSVRKLNRFSKKTEWHDYYEKDSYCPAALNHKIQIVIDFLEEVRPGSVWDLGANTGLFSRLASDRGIPTVSFDIDPACVETSYLRTVSAAEKNILPLVLDLTNPSPGLGWENRERMSLAERGPADMVLALAVIHHLAISNNVPLNRIAGFLNNICNTLVIEFIPKSDPKVRKLLATREDVFPDYQQESFEKEFGRLFSIQAKVNISESQRTLYLMARKEV
jgi:ribosomal protein L11 methylase PrmA